MSQDIHTYLGLDFNPFSPATTSEGYFQTENTRQILEEFYFGIKARKGFLLLLGEVGVGKTSLLLQLLKKTQSEEELHTAWIFNTILDQENLLRTIALDFGLSINQNSNLAQIIEKLHGHILEVNQSGGNCAIIVDEAHGLSIPALESLRMLSNLEGEGKKMVQILLAGQPELELLLQKPQLRQMRSRINILKTLWPLTKEETFRYINFKLASANSQLRLPRKALPPIWTAARGNTRMIHLIMDRVLHAFVINNNKQLHTRIIKQAIDDIAGYQPELGQRLKRRRNKQLLATVGFLTLIVLLLSFLPIVEGQHRRISVVDCILQDKFGWKRTGEQFNAPSASPSAIKRAIKNKSRTLNSARQKDYQLSPSGSTALEKDTRQNNKGTDLNSTSIKQVSRKKETSSEEVNTSVGRQQVERKRLLSFLQTYDLQNLLPYLQEAVIKKDIDILQEMLPGHVEALRLEKLPDGNVIECSKLPWRAIVGSKPNWLVLWEPLLKLDKKFPNRSAKAQVLSLQKMLDELGYYHGPWDGEFGAESLQALKAFQSANDLPVTQGPDKRTLFWICVKYENFQSKRKESSER